MKEKVSWKVSAIMAAGLLVLGTAAGAQQQIPAGIDIWATPDDGSTHVTVTIPPGFFGCDDSADADASTVTIPLKGKRLVTSPAGVLGSTDTVVYRSRSAVLDDGETVTLPIEVVGLSLVGAAPFTACGESYTVRVCRATTQPAGSTITITASGNGGTFDASLDVDGVVTFTNASGTLGPLRDSIWLQTTGAHWADQVGANGIDYSGSVKIDQDCSGQPDDPSFPGTSGFHPGWSWNPPPGYGCPSPPCQVPTPHDGPHGTVVPRPVLEEEPVEKEPVGIE